jgi:hypothetical protein
MSHVTYLTWLEGGYQFDRHGLLFRLRGGSPRNSLLVIDSHALAEALNQKGGRGRPSPPGRRIMRFV